MKRAESTRVDIHCWPEHCLAAAMKVRTERGVWRSRTSDKWVANLPQPSAFSVTVIDRSEVARTVMVRDHSDSFADHCVSLLPCCYNITKYDQTFLCYFKFRRPSTELLHRLLGIKCSIFPLRLGSILSYTLHVSHL